MFGVIADIFQNLWNNDQAENRQEDSQTFSAEQAAIAREYNSAEALAQRNWQTEMSNTSVRRNKADLKAAGFNPLLAIHPGGGAPFGSGASASTSGATSGIASPHTGHSIAASMATASQVDVNEAQAEKLRAEADEARERTKNYDPQRREIEARIPVHQEEVKKIQQLIAQSAVEIEKIWQDVTHSQTSALNITQQTQNLKETIPLIKTQIGNLRALTSKASAETEEIKQRVKENLPAMERILLDLERKTRVIGMPQHENAERAQESLMGQIGAYLGLVNKLPPIFSRSTTINRGK